MAYEVNETLKCNDGQSNSSKQLLFKSFGLDLLRSTQFSKVFVKKLALQSFVDFCLHAAMGHTNIGIQLFGKRLLVKVGHFRNGVLATCCRYKKTTALLRFQDAAKLS